MYQNQGYVFGQNIIFVCWEHDTSFMIEKFRGGVKKNVFFTSSKKSETPPPPPFLTTSVLKMVKNGQKWSKNVKKSEYFLIRIFCRNVFVDVSLNYLPEQPQIDIVCISTIFRRSVF